MIGQFIEFSYLSRTQVLTRKAHPCFECDRQIAKGTHTCRVLIKDRSDGSVLSGYLCGSCECREVEILTVHDYLRLGAKMGIA